MRQVTWDMENVRKHLQKTITMRKYYNVVINFPNKI
ncbi:hypothetical protein [Blautia obeum]|nr:MULTISPECIES: hypothetical protein [Clostridia]